MNAIEVITRKENGSLPLGQAQHFQQTGLWAEFKSRHGWRPYCFAVSAQYADTPVSFEILVFVRTFARCFSLAYIPLAPDFDLVQAQPDIQFHPDFPAFLKELGQGIRAHLPGNVLCIRFDPPLESSLDKKDSIKREFKKNGILKTLTDIQPPDTVILDLAPSHEELLNQMKSKWRYNIKLAEKKGVRIQKYSGSVPEQAIDTFYKLYEQTARRDAIAVHKKAYYADLLQLAASHVHNNPHTSLYIAEHEGLPIAAVITLCNRHEGVYLYGASSNEKRNLMPSYLLQWTAIIDAKSNGCRIYDFYGIPPTDDEKHPMHGLFRFKTGFGGNIVHRIGSFDVPCSPLYSLYRIAEQLRAFWYKRIKKKFSNR